MKKLTSMLLALTFAFSALCTQTLANPRFNDVPAAHWANSYIAALADGGLVQGYGGGKFGPDDTLNIDQMATIICNAKGYYGDSGNSYWGYDAVEHCINDLYCLPSHGTINAANYSVPCSRELAVYMMTKALGSDGTAQTNVTLTAKDIPDYALISLEYAPTILKAYQLGLINGKDDKGTFDPKANLTRAEVCTVLYRAGFTTAVEKPETDKPSTGMSEVDIYDELISWGHWREKTAATGSVKEEGGGSALHNTKQEYGNITVSLNSNKSIFITMKEYDSSFLLKDELWLAYLSSGASDFRDENGKIAVVSAFSYESRQLVKEILTMVFPNDIDEVYGAMLSVMRQEIYECPGDNTPAALRWVDGRYFRCVLNDTDGCVGIYIGAPGDKEPYDVHMGKSSVPKNFKYASHFGIGRDLNTYYELWRG